MKMIFRQLMLEKIFRKIWLALNHFFSIWSIIKTRKHSFVMFHYWPKRAEEIHTWSDKLIHSPSLAIVMQGPVDKEEDFTLETIKIYRKNFDNTKIIVSTWDNEDDNYLKLIQNEGAIVLKNKKPVNPGPLNINMQITSSLCGIKRAEDLGADYVMKTRTDQRIYGVNVKEFLINLINTFPVKSGYGQKKRIISTNYISFKYTPYLISDMTMFGDLSDMKFFWEVNPDERNSFPLKRPVEREYIKRRPSEIYLATEFLKKIGREPKWSITDYWQILADHFCIVDIHDLDMYWHKPKRHKLRINKYLRYDGIKNTRTLSFLEWFNLYTNFNNKDSRFIPERALDEMAHGLISNHRYL